MAMCGVVVPAAATYCAGCRYILCRHGWLADGEGPLLHVSRYNTDLAGIITFVWFYYVETSNVAYIYGQSGIITSGM